MISDPLDESLRRLLRHRDYLAARLAATERQVADAGRRFSFRRGYRMPLRLEALRREVGA